MPPACKICSHESRTITIPKSEIKYHTCAFCEFIFIDDGNLLSKEEEKSRYRKHDNTLENKGYVNMLNDFIEKSVAPYKDTIKRVLDFGCGHEPVLKTLLKDKGLDVDIYDKFYAPDKVYINNKYDLITATEVLEHLTDPLYIFDLFRNLLNINGIISVMTHFHPRDDKIFTDWWYRRDRTHISFYTPKTIGYLARKFGLKLLQCDGKNICVLRAG